MIMFNISIAQISIRIWSNALYNSRGNQINIAPITILLLLFTNQIKCWFLMRGENRSIQGKTSRGRVEDQQTQSTWHRVRKSNSGQIGGRQVLSPQDRHCHQKAHTCDIHLKTFFFEPQGSKCNHPRITAQVLFQKWLQPIKIFDLEQHIIVPS